MSYIGIHVSCMRGKEEQYMRKKVVSFFIVLGLVLSMSVNAVSAGEENIPAEVGETLIEDVESEEEVLVGEVSSEEENLSGDTDLEESAPAAETESVVEGINTETASEQEALTEDANPSVEEPLDLVGTGSYFIDSWWAGAKEEAREADHVIGYDEEIGDVFGFNKLTYSYVRYFTVIQPGETIAILPQVSLNNFGVQGGISYFSFTIWQMEEAVADTEFLTRSTPEKTELTPLKTKVMPVPYEDRLVDHPDDPAHVGDGGLAEVSYVSLYRNDTGLPIVLNGARGGSFTKSGSYGTVWGVNDGRTNYQGQGTKSYGPTLYFAEPYYDIVIDKAAQYGTYYYQRNDVDFSKLWWPKPLSDYTLRVYFDAEDHTYELPLPVMERRKLSIYESYNGGPFTPNEGARDGDVYTYSVNLVNKSHQYTQPNLNEYLRDQHIRPVYDGGPTLSFDAAGGTIGGQEKKYFEVTTPNSTINLTDYVSEEPVYEGHIFLGWCTDPDDPEGSITTSIATSGTEHKAVYAAWKELKDISDATISGVTVNYGYSGKAYTPTVKVVLDGVTLTKDTDYKVKYENNIQPGTAKITVTGIGNYTGTKIKTFGIVQCVSSIVSGKTYMLIPKNNSQAAVCAYGGNMVNNTKLHLSDRSNSESMKFIAQKNSDGTWKFINSKCELAVAVASNSTAVGKGVLLYNQTSNKAQNWKLTRKSDNSFAITNAVSQLDITMSDISAVKGTTLSTGKPAASSLQRFYFVETDPVDNRYDGVYALKAGRNKNFSVKVASSSKTDGANINLYTYSGTNAQKFKFIYSGGGYYRLQNVNSGLVVTVKDNSNADAANIIQSAWKGASGQRWKVTKNANGTVTLKNGLGTVMHLLRNEVKNNTNVHARKAASTTAQQWYLEK